MHLHCALLLQGVGCVHCEAARTPFACALLRKLPGTVCTCCIGTVRVRYKSNSVHTCADDFYSMKLPCASTVCHLLCCALSRPAMPTTLPAMRKLPGGTSCYGSINVLSINASMLPWQQKLPGGRSCHGTNNALLANPVTVKSHVQHSVLYQVHVYCMLLCDASLI